MPPDTSTVLPATSPPINATSSPPGSSCEGVSDPQGVSFYILQWDDKQPVGWVWNWTIGQGVKELIRTGGITTGSGSRSSCRSSTRE